ncbi:MAG: ABC transporter permease [Actinomycetota bacterium]|nr:ABC transporter permease [Actinomycetota bacterium]
MRNPRFLKVAWRIILGLRNDIRTLALMFLAPIFAMFVFGLAFSGEVEDVKVMVVNQDQGITVPVGGGQVSISQMVIDNLDPEVVVVEYAESEKEGVAAVENGNVYAALVFPPDLTANALEKIGGDTSAGDATIKLRLDKSNVNVANAITKAVSDALLKTVEQVGEEPAVSISTGEAIYGENARFIDFFVPGVLAFVVFVLTTLLTLISFVSERTSGTLDRLLATPLGPGDIVMGYATAFSLVGLIQSALLLIVGVAAFHIIIEGNVLLAFLAVAMLAVVSQALGILLSSLAKQEAQAIQFFPFIILPAFLLAGIFWPLEAIPTWLRPLSYLVPPTYTADACRSVMLKGWGLGKIWVDLLALMGFAAAFLALAMLSLKVRKD